MLDALNPQNKERYLALDPLTMAKMAMKMMKEAKLEEYGVGMKQKTQYGVSGSGYGDAKPAAPAGKKLSPTKMAMAYMQSKGMDTSGIDVLSLVDHLRQAGAKDEQSVQAAVDDFLQMQEADDYRFDGNLRMDDVKAVMKKVGLQNADPNEIFDEYGHLDNLEQLENILSKRRDLKEREATNTIRESVSRFMKVTLREEGRRK